MIVLLIALVASYVLEAALFRGYWSKRRILAPASAFVGVFAASGMNFWHFNSVSCAIGLVAVYRFLMSLIIVQGRGHDAYLQGKALKSVRIFGAIHFILSAAWAVTATVAVEHIFTYITYAGSVFVGLAGVSVCLSVLSAWKATKYTRVDSHPHTKDLPAVTLAIPARNETEALERMLTASLASTYPKLEILVLDDCSQDATADVIRSFAHDGVRFIQGDPVPDGHWVHKNFACHQLLEHASGSLVLFAGVDVVLAPDSISQMVAHLTKNKLKMLAVIPAREASMGFSFVQTIRYWWELALPRKLLRRPPVLSSCWLADVHALKKTGGFEAVSRMVVPEAFFAREFGSKGAYRLVRGNDGLGISSRKSSTDQINTAVRVRYPQLRRRPELALALMSLWLFFWIVPLAGIVLSSSYTVFSLFALIGWLGYSASYVLVSQFYAARGLALTMLASPLLALVDLVLIHASLYQYEFGHIEWKGRNVCLPVMHVYKSLPKID